MLVAFSLCTHHLDFRSVHVGSFFQFAKGIRIAIGYEPLDRARSREQPGDTEDAEEPGEIAGKAPDQTVLGTVRRAASP